MALAAPGRAWSGAVECVGCAGAGTATTVAALAGVATGGAVNAGASEDDMLGCSLCDQSSAASSNAAPPTNPNNTVRCDGLAATGAACSGSVMTTGTPARRFAGPVAVGRRFVTPLAVGRRLVTPAAVGSGFVTPAADGRL